MYYQYTVMELDRREIILKILIIGVGRFRVGEGVSHSRVGEGVGRFRVGEGVNRFRVGKGVSHSRVGEGVSRFRVGEGVNRFRLGEGVSHSRAGKGMRLSRDREYISHSMRDVVVKVQSINIGIIMTRLMTGNETERTISNRFNTRDENRNTRTKMMETMQVMKEILKGSVVESRYGMETK